MSDASFSSKWLGLKSSSPAQSSTPVSELSSELSRSSSAKLLLVPTDGWSFAVVVVVVVVLPPPDRGRVGPTAHEDLRCFAAKLRVHRV